MNHKPHEPETKFGLLKASWQGVLIGLCTGALVGSFRLTHNWCFPRLLSWLDSSQGQVWIPFFWGAVLLCLVLAVGRLVLAVPLIHGSGIPQTELVLAGKLLLSRPHWFRILAAKWLGSWLALLGGLSLGREGPSVQMGGAVGALYASAAKRPSQAVSGAPEASGSPDASGEKDLSGSPYVMAGAAAGLAAAFGAPCAGLIFVFEEMKSHISPRNAVFVFSATISAELLVSQIFGLGQLFPFSHFTPPPLTDFWSLGLLGVFMGFFGVAYNSALLRIKDTEARQTVLPAQLRTLTAFTMAGILAFTFPQILGGGDGLIAQVGVESLTQKTLLIFIALKFAFSLFSFTGDVPGGLLMPLLCIGALAGQLFGLELTQTGLLEPGAADGFLIFGMAGLFAASVRAPLTGVSLVTEMSGAAACLPGAFMVACIAAFTATALGCPPVYDSLKERVVLPPPRLAGDD